MLSNLRTSVFVIAKTKGLGFSAATLVLLLSLLLAFAASLAEPNLDKTQALAQQRYGERAAQTVAAWRQLIE